jgi:hypothetical protein
LDFLRALAKVRIGHFVEAQMLESMVSVRRRRKPPMDPARATAKLPTCAESTLDRGLPVATHWRRGTPKPSTCSVRAA